jgi:seryl-tRNA synthetase
MAADSIFEFLVGDTMDETKVLMAIGELRGNIQGLEKAQNAQLHEIRNDIKEIKDILKERAADCTACRKEIEAEITKTQKDSEIAIEAIKKDVQNITFTHVGDDRVSAWKDKTLTEIVTIVGATTGLIVFLISFVHFIYTGQWF